MDEELIHHGIKGMKWGVRRFQDKSGRLTAAGKKRYSEDSPVDKSPKQTRYDKLYAKYKTLGYSDEKARQTAKGRVNVERTLAVIGGATVAAAIAYASYKYYDANIDRFIAPNKMLQTVHTGDVSNRIKPGNPFMLLIPKGITRFMLLNCLVILPTKVTSRRCIQKTASKWLARVPV